MNGDEISANQNLYNPFDARFPAAGAAVCMSLPDGRAIRYHDLKAQSARVANLLTVARSTTRVTGVRLKVHTGQRYFAASGIVRSMNVICSF